MAIFPCKMAELGFLFFCVFWGLGWKKGGRVYLWVLSTYKIQLTRQYVGRSRKNKIFSTIELIFFKKGLKNSSLTLLNRKERICITICRLYNSVLYFDLLCSGFFWTNRRVLLVVSVFWTVLTAEMCKIVHRFSEDIFSVFFVFKSIFLNKKLVCFPRSSYPSPLYVKKLVSQSWLIVFFIWRTVVVL